MEAEESVRLAILATRATGDLCGEVWDAWADAWLAGKDRTPRSAEEAWDDAVSHIAADAARGAQRLAMGLVSYAQDIASATIADAVWHAEQAGHPIDLEALRDAPVTEGKGDGDNGQT